MRIEASVVRGLVEQASRLQLAAVALADCGRINVAADLQATGQLTTRSGHQRPNSEG